MKDIVAANLKRVRAAKNWPQDKVAEAAGLSRGAYRKIENGEAQARVSSLDAIAAALQVPLRELLEPTVELKNVRFRSHKKLRLRSKILTDVGRWLSNYNGLEDQLGSRRPFRLHEVGEQAGTGEDRAVAAARAARAALGLSESEPVRDICGLLDSAGVKVFPLAVDSDGFFGLAVGPSDGGPAVVINTWERISVERWIFTAAHELGHLLLHQGDFGQDTEEEDEVLESEANAFAAEFLMPDGVFRREWAEARGLPLVARVIKVKRIFRVSYRTVLYRLAPTYQGWADNIWVQFRFDYMQQTGQSLSKTEEPAGITGNEFMTAAPEVLRGREPDHLSPGDFREDRLAGLVRRALEEGEISLGRAAEILGLSLIEVRALAASWVG